MSQLCSHRSHTACHGPDSICHAERRVTSVKTTGLGLSLLSLQIPKKSHQLERSQGSSECSVNILQWDGGSMSRAAARAVSASQPPGVRPRCAQAGAWQPVLSRAAGPEAELSLDVQLLPSRPPPPRQQPAGAPVPIWFGGNKRRPTKRKQVKSVPGLL